MCLCDFDNDEELELIVGSEDYDIRVFKGDEIIAEFSETEAVIALHPVSGNRFAYALINGTLGLYEGSNRLWRIKSKTFAMSLCLYDINGDNELELATGWSGGKVDFRSWKNGALVVKDHLNSAVVGLAEARLPEKGTSYLVCCSIDGEVRGYRADISAVTLASDAMQDECRALSLQKQSLLLELKNYEEPRKSSSTSEFSISDKTVANVIPATTQVRATLCVNPGSGKEQLEDWLRANFLTPEENYIEGDELQARFFSLHGSGMLFIKMSSDGEARILCDDMSVCGELIQTIATDFGIGYLESKADFKSDVSLLMDLLKKVDEIYLVRSNVAGVIAEKCSLAKSMLIRAEDARLTDDISQMKSFYKELRHVNNELVTHYNVYCANHAELLNKLKQINVTIQNASKLRGKQYNCSSAISFCLIICFRMLICGKSLPLLVHQHLVRRK
ncbi:unnamed protein product [Soboliphyme baturini]|uniref:BBS2_Mid domain-containing protein n=1 Tax=Soboliphyme baturini TaxID=241478 RepID=A0A183IS31_9BILA|nr:unnamed protein product [Soboliphyme baturini]